MARCWKGFQAAIDIDAGRLPKRRDAVEYIDYLRDMVQGLATIVADQAKELEQLRGPLKWDAPKPTFTMSVAAPYDWPASPDAWKLAKEVSATCALADDTFKKEAK